MALEIPYPDYACPECGWYEGWKIVKCRNQGGSWQHLYVCTCGHRTTHFIPKKLILKLGIDAEEIEPRRSRHRCEVCGADGAENHHWAPFHIFSDEAEKWPKSYLCPTCHKKWHDMVTPGMSQGGQTGF